MTENQEPKSNVETNAQRTAEAENKPEVIKPASDAAPEAAAKTATEAAPAETAPATEEIATAPAAVKSAEAKPAAAAEKPAAEAVKPAAAAAKPAAAAEKKPVEESPETIAKREAAQKVLDTVKQKITAQFGDDAFEETGLQKFQPTFVIKPEHWFNVVRFLKEEPSLAFNYPECFAGTDYPAKGYIEIALYLQSMQTKLFITVKVRTPREQAEVDSLCPIFIGANWEEREIYDLLGVNFKGHPNLVRIMLDDDFKGHPLRKDYSVWEE